METALQFTQVEGHPGNGIRVTIRGRHGSTFVAISATGRSAKLVARLDNGATESITGFNFCPSLNDVENTLARKGLLK